MAVTTWAALLSSARQVVNEQQRAVVTPT
jgi:hypothetical protein